MPSSTFGATVFHVITTVFMPRLTVKGSLFASSSLVSFCASSPSPPALSAPVFSVPVFSPSLLSFGAACSASVVREKTTCPSKSLTSIATRSVTGVSLGPPTWKQSRRFFWGLRPRPATTSSLPGNCAIGTGAQTQNGNTACSADNSRRCGKPSNDENERPCVAAISSQPSTPRSVIGTIGRVFCSRCQRRPSSKLIQTVRAVPQYSSPPTTGSGRMQRVNHAVSSPPVISRHVAPKSLVAYRYGRKSSSL